jgi:hypothetical protein
MPIKIISPRNRVQVKQYMLVFDVGEYGAGGWSFPCDEKGVVDTTQLAPIGLESYNQAITGKTSDGRDILKPYVENTSYSYIDHAVGECVCGEHVTLDGFTCTCENCGADYNSSGQRLAPREQWGDDTGETLEEILRIP